MNAVLVWTVIQIISGEFFTVQYEYQFKTYADCTAALEVLLAEQPNADAYCVEQA